MKIALIAAGLSRRKRLLQRQILGNRLFFEGGVQFAAWQPETRRDAMRITKTILKHLLLTSVWLSFGISQPALSGQKKQAIEYPVSIIANCDDLNRRKVKTFTLLGEISTSLTNFIDIYGANLSFNVSQRSCVVVTFSARANTPDEAMLVRAKLDDSQYGHPRSGIEVAFSSYEIGGPTSARSFTWLFPSVAAGPHSLKMQWRSESGKGVYLSQQTLDVSYR